MSCDRNAKVQAWYDGELPEGDRAGVEQHLRECAECAQVVAELRQMSQMLVAAPRVQMGADAKRRLEQAWWANRDRGVLRMAEWLTAAAAAVLVGALMFWSDGDRPVQPPTQVASWEPEAVMPPTEARDELASNDVTLAEWMANDLSVEGSR